MNHIQALQLNNRPVASIGNSALLDRSSVGLLCSRKCPAAIILEAHSFFKKWAANPETTVISGFHSPVEKECLSLLLKGVANIIICSAREIEDMRIPSDWKPALDAGRMLILSPFAEKRASVQTIDQRNQLVADLANELYVPYASPDGNLSREGIA